MKLHEYAEAIYLAAQGKDDSELDRLVVRVQEVVERHGHRKLLPARVSRESPTVVCDDMLIGGYEVRTEGSRIDRTHKRALVDLYSALIRRS